MKLWDYYQTKAYGQLKEAREEESPKAILWSSRMTEGALLFNIYLFSFRFDPLTVLNVDSALVRNDEIFDLDLSNVKK